jgi:hypothetical protein
LNFIVYSRLAALLSAAVLLTVACASAPSTNGASLNGGALLGLEEPVAVSTFSFEKDTFAFPNMIRSRHPDDEPGLYANYCFVLARGIRQFAQYVRFDPALPKLDQTGYVERVKQVAARSPWEPVPPPADRIVIPGYANLREFSRDQEAAVKEGMGGRWLTMFHWTNWRVALPISDDHQERLAYLIVDEIRAGRLVQLLVSNFPKPELNHTVVVFESIPKKGSVDFVVWDPNNPDGPGIITFDQGSKGFWATDVYDTDPGPIRAYRMYYSRLL